MCHFCNLQICVLENDENALFWQICVLENDENALFCSFRECIIFVTCKFAFWKMTKMQFCILENDENALFDA
jgi:hypothetical protein